MEAEVSYCGLRSIISWIQEREASHGQQCHPADDIRLAHESITPSSPLQMRRQQALGSLQCLVRTSDDQWALIVSINLRFPLIEVEEVSRARLCWQYWNRGGVEVQAAFGEQLQKQKVVLLSNCNVRTIYTCFNLTPS